MTTKTHAFAISRTFIRQIHRDYPKSATTYTVSKRLMIHQSRLSDGQHLHTFETYERRPYVQELMGMNCTLTAVGLPFLRYCDHVKVYLWGDWVRRPVWYLKGMRTSTVRNLTIQKKILETGLVFLTIAEIDGVRNAK
jgi:hypothetical protein